MVGSWQAQAALSSAAPVMESSSETSHPGPVRALRKLPVETLGEIFTFLLEPEPTEDTLEDDCISASQVCLRWRQVALKTPTLWTRIPASYPEWAFTLLKRSASQNIQVEFSHTNTNPHPFPAVLRWMLRYRSDSINSISLVNIISVPSSVFPSIPIFPKLQRFRYQPRSNEMSASDQTLLQGILRKTKRLLSVELPILVDFCQSAIYIRNMTELRIGDCGNVQGANIRDWLDALKGMPNLQTLLVNGQLPWSSVEEQDMVSLPHLKYISLYDEILSITEFLPHIRFPPTTTLLLVLEFQEIDFTEIGEMRYVMERALRNYHDVGVWQCIRLAPNFTDDEIPHPSFSAWHGLSAADWIVREEPPRTYPQACVAFKFPDVNVNPDVLHDILAETAALMKCKDVEYLEILPSEGWHDDLDEGGRASAVFAATVVKAFQDMDSLRTISCQASVGTSALLNFISTYSILGEGHGPESTQPPLFNALQTMQFVSYRGQFKNLLQIPLVFDMLRTMHRAGHPVTSVAFYTCEFPQAFFQQRQAMTGSEYRPWGPRPIGFELEEVEEVQVHMDDLEATFYFYNCTNTA